MPNRRFRPPSEAQPGVNAPPSQTLPPKQRPGLRIPIGDALVPSRRTQQTAKTVDDLFDCLEELDVDLRTLIQFNVQTLDTVVFEHDTQELPTSVETFTLTLEPQTRQQELITGLFAAIVSPTQAAAGSYTLSNAWAQLGPDYVDALPLLDTTGGPAGSIPGMMQWILNADSVRSLTIVAESDFPADTFLTFALFGMTVPSTLGEVLT